jgi:hypothetical protein
MVFFWFIHHAGRRWKKNSRFGLEALDWDTVQEGDERSDRSLAEARRIYALEVDLCEYVQGGEKLIGLEV